MGSTNRSVQASQDVVVSAKFTGLRVSRLVAALAIGLASWGVAQAAPPAAATAAAEDFAQGRILVLPRAGLTDASLTKILGEHGGGRARRVGNSPLRIVDLPPGLEKQMVDKLSRHPHIKFAELDRIVAPGLVTNDPFLGSEWHLSKIGAGAAWDQARGDGVTIAILDSGVDGSHPDLAARLVAGWNVYDGNSNTADVYGHGTKVAGAAAAALDNAVGVAGVAGSAKLMPIRISATTGSAAYSAMAQGITWAADNGAKVANLSFRAAGSASVNSAAAYMKSKGGLVVSSAGNNAVNEGFAITTSMIPVSSTGTTDLISGFSSFGDYVAVSAPGEGIYTTTNGGGYGSVSGTSFSSPITAGVLALIMSANPTLKNTDVEAILYSTALDLGTAGRDIYYGHGRVNATAAVTAALNTTAPTDVTPPTALISTPLGSSTVSGLVPVNVTATDMVGVTKVELRVNGTVVATDTASPYAFSWDSNTVANGMSSLVATAYDAAGNNKASTAVSVNVANNLVADTLPPALSIKNPVGGAKVTGTVSISTAASDDSGTVALKQWIYVDGTLVASGTGATLSYSWNTRKFAAGAHAISAVAQDAAGNKTSTALSVTK
jgi:hypothetical protein